MINVSLGKGRMRVSLLLPAFFTSLFAAVPLIISAPVAAQPADVCITAPSFQPPEGNRWYYRVDRASNRKCWYIASQSLKLQPVGSVKTLPPAKPISPAMAQTLPEQPTVTTAASDLNTPRVAALFPGLPSWWTSVASSARWPLAGNFGGDSDLKDDPRDETSTRALNLTTAESAPSGRSPDQGVTSAHMLLLFAGALAFAAIVGRAISKNSAARRRNRAVPLRRRAEATAARRRPEIGREFREPKKPYYDVEDARLRARQRQLKERRNPVYS